MKVQSYKKLRIYICLHIILFLICNLPIINAQNLLNPSLEGIHQDATMPDNWLSATPGTTPDILPETWGERLEPYDGDAYVGLITRSNGTFEAITQRLPQPTQPQNCYELEFALASSAFYAGYNEPIRCRVWLSKNKAERSMLVKDFGLIKNTNWEFHKIQFFPEDEYHFIIFEAYHPKEQKTSKGNILIDNILGPKSCPRT